MHTCAGTRSGVQHDVWYVHGSTSRDVYLGVSGHFPFHANPLSFHTAIIMSRPVKRVSAMRCATGRRKGTDKQALDREEYSSIAKENISPVT